MVIGARNGSGLGVLAFLLLGGGAWAQPQCSFNMGPDQVICDGAFATISAPGGYANYLWSTGATGSSISVQTAGTYSCQITYDTGNLVNNGDFSAGNTGFSTFYNYNPNLQQEGNYYIGSNAGQYHPFWQGFGNQFLMVNAGLFQFFWNFWCQTITVCPGQTYTLSYQAANLSDVGPANIQWVIDGAAQPAMQVTGFLGTWNTYTTTWTAGVGQTSADICLRMINTSGVGHDLGIDDISVSAQIVMTDAVDVSVLPVPVVDLGPDISTCAGTPVVLDATTPGALGYLWSTGATSATISPGVSATYWVEVAGPSGCPGSDTVVVDLLPAPVVDLGPDLDLCPGTTTTLDATSAGASYLWNTGATSGTLQVGPGNYSVTVTSNGCSSMDAITIGSLPAPTVDLGPDTTLCPGASLLLDATTPGVSYLWQDASMGSTLLASQAGTYHVTVTNGSNCIDQDTVLVSYATVTPVDLGPDTTICSGTSLTLDASVPGATGYQWNTGGAGPTIQVNTAGNYSVTVDQSGCSSTDQVQVSVLQAPAVFLGTDTTLCPGASVLLDATTPGASYLWQDGSTAPTLLADQPGTYWVEVEVGGACPGRDTIQVAFVSQAALDLGPDVVLCQGEQVLLDGTLPGATSYLWNTGANTPTLQVSTAGTYWVEAGSGNCSVRDTVLVNVLPAPSPVLGPDTTLCVGELLQLDANAPGSTLLWSTGATSATIQVQNSGSYWVQATLGPCTAADTILVTFQPPPVVDLGMDTTLCMGSTLTLQPPATGTTTWSTGAIGGALVISTAGTYWAQVDLGSCSASDTVVVSMAPVPVVDLGTDTTICQGNTLQLDVAQAGATYLWSDGSDQATLSVNTAGDYWVQVDLGACQASDTIAVAVQAPPAVDLGTDTTLCAGQTLLMDAFVSGGSYLWQDGSGQSTFTASQAGTYWVEVTVSGCPASDTLVIDAVLQVTAELGPDTTLCSGQDLVLDVLQAGADYLWSDGTAQPSLTVNSAGTYWVEVSLNGCDASDTILVDVVNATAFDLGPDLDICPQDNVVIVSGAAPGSITWSDGSQDPDLTVSGPGTFWAVVEVNGCFLSDTVQVVSVDLAIPDLGDDLTACLGDTVVLAVDPEGADVLWSDGSVLDSLVVTGDGVFSVTLTGNGCQTTDEVGVTFVDPGMALDLGPDQGLCTGDQLVLDAGPGWSDLLWNTGSTSRTLLVLRPGVYSVEAEGPCGLSQDEIVIQEEDCALLVHVPNAFTPNNDGYNDVFVPVLNGIPMEYEFVIFDRWGSPVFESEEPGKAWDGSIDGSLVQDGVFAWKLHYKALTPLGLQVEDLLGHVVVLR